MKKRLITGIQPTGELTIGNYIGSIKQLLRLQEELEDFEILMFIADLHALTTPQDRTKLRQSVLSVAAMYLACGINPEKVKIFVQSEVPAHNQLAYIMESTVYIGELERMTQYKDKRISQTDGIRSSLLTYPALMAADILLYDANIVPIGDDQRQHLELTRLAANRFNSQYGDTFTVPEPMYPKVGGRIKSLTEPTKKMSKSADNIRSYILLLDNINQAKNKIRSAVTDSDTKIYFDEENKPGISNLLSIYSSLTEKTIKELELEYQNKSYQELKEDLAEIVGNLLEGIQEKYHQILKSKELKDLLDEGRDYANNIAFKKVRQVYRKIGIERR